MKSSQKAFGLIVIEEDSDSSKYRRWHDQIINRAKMRSLDGYFERHHILPRCFGGGDGAGNLVKLTFREHFIIHWLLTKFTRGSNLNKMRLALSMMSRRREGRVVSSWQYDLAKRSNRQAMSERRLSADHKRKIGEATARRHARNRASRPVVVKAPYIRTAEHNQKIGIAISGRTVSVETRIKIGRSSKGRRDTETTTIKRRMSHVGLRHTEETKNKMREAAFRRYAECRP